jgi:hypothetical protein
MDTVTPGGRHAVLRQKVHTARTALHRAASASFLNGDPLAEQLLATSAAIGILTDIHEAAQTTRTEIAGTLKAQTDSVTKEASLRVEASTAAVLEKLAPQLAAAADRTMRQKFSLLQARTIFLLAAILLAIATIPSAFTYAAGLNLGRTQGEIVGGTINTAMRYGPDAALAWSKLMQNNDPVPAMAICTKDITTTSDGRRAGAMPVWLDPANQTIPTQQP